MTPTRLICIQTHFAHWSGHSGYHQFLKHLPADIHVTHVRVSPGRVGGEGLPRWRMEWLRLATRVAKTRANPWTTANDLLTEFRLLLQVRGSLRKGGKTIVHFLDGEYGYNYFWILRRLLGSAGGRFRLVASYHQPESLLASLMPYKHRTKQLDLVLTVGTSQVNFFDFLPDTRVRFVPHGIDTDFYHATNQPVEDGTIFCLTVGHWMRDFDALEQVIRSCPERVIFRIVALEEHTKRFRNLNNVQLYSGINDEELLHLYQSSHIGLLPLRDTTANNGLLEMMACGLPIITTRVGSLMDYLPDGAGVLLDSNDIGELNRAVRRLATSKVERVNLGNAARRRALELDWTNMASEMAEIYRGL